VLIPVADFVANNVAPVEGETVEFTDLSTNTPTSWLWVFTPSTVTFVDGTSSTSQNPHVQFDNDGVYQAKLTATNAAGSDDEVKEDYIDSWILENSLLFDGSDEAIEIDALRTNELAGTTTGTWSVWARPAALGSTLTLLGFGKTAGGISVIDYYIKPGGDIEAACFAIGAVKWILVTTAAHAVANTWIHIALVHNGTEPNLYINGVDVAATFTLAIDKTAWFSVASDLDNGRIGAQNHTGGGNTSTFDGHLTEVAVYDDALTPTEITEIYNSGVPIKLTPFASAANLQGWFRMGERSDFVSEFTLPDESVNTNDGTSINMELADKTTEIPP